MGAAGIGPVRAVIIEDALQAVVIAQLRGEGEAWLSHHHVRLSDDMNTLTDVLEQGNVIRHRCPGKSPY